MSRSIPIPDPAPLSWLPEGVTEADLIDVVEGGLAKDREAVLIEALRREPRLGLLIKQLRSDRAGLVDLGAVRLPMPIGMVEAIEAKLNRAALSELVEDAAHAPAAIPISTVQVRRSGVLHVIAESAWARRLATAASVAIVGGIGYLAVRELARQWPSDRRPSSVVQNDGAGRTVDPVRGEPERGATEVAIGPGPESVPVDPAGGAGTIASAEPTDSGTTALTAAEAARLAEQGRLVIAVRSSAYAGTVKHLEELSRVSKIETRWRAYLPNELPREFAALASARPGTAGTIDNGGRGRPPEPMTLAHDPSEMVVGIPETGPGPGVGLGPMFPPARVVVQTVRIVQLPASAQAMDDLIKDLAVFKGHEAEFVVLPEGAAMSPSPTMDAESVLWWTRSPGGWVKRVSVPVVVETVE